MSTKFIPLKEKKNYCVFWWEIYSTRNCFRSFSEGIQIKYIKDIHNSHSRPFKDKIWNTLKII